MSHRKVLRIALLAAAFLMMALIFYFSAQNDVQSGKTSGEVTEFVLNTVVPEYKKMAGAKRQSYRKTAELIIRKLAHFSEYAVLGALLTGYFYLRRRDDRLLTALPMGWGLASLYACTDEFHQMFVSGRGPSPTDVGIDSGGALLGAALVIAVIALRHRRLI